MLKWLILRLRRPIRALSHALIELEGGRTAFRDEGARGERLTAMDPLVAAVLTPAQQEEIDDFRALNVPGSWFIGRPPEDGRVEVICLGEDFVWSFILSADGQDVASQEASLGEFSTGISV